MAMSSFWLSGISSEAHTFSNLSWADGGASIPSLCKNNVKGGITTYVSMLKVA